MLGRLIAALVGSGKKSSKKLIPVNKGARIDVWKKAKKAKGNWVPHDEWVKGKRRK